MAALAYLLHPMVDHHFLGLVCDSVCLRSAIDIGFPKDAIEILY
jgi:hypothetical protein